LVAVIFSASEIFCKVVISIRNLELYPDLVQKIKLEPGTTN